MISSGVSLQVGFISSIFLEVVLIPQQHVQANIKAIPILVLPDEMSGSPVKGQFYHLST